MHGGRHKLVGIRFAGHGLRYGTMCWDDETWPVRRHHSAPLPVVMPWVRRVHLKAAGVDSVVLPDRFPALDWIPGTEGICYVSSGCRGCIMGRTSFGVISWAGPCGQEEQALRNAPGQKWVDHPVAG